MTDQVNAGNATDENTAADNAGPQNSNTTDYPEVMSVADLIADIDGFVANVSEASEGIPQERQFRNFDNPEQLPENFQVVIDPRDSGSFAADKNGAALFVYAMPTYEAIAAQGEAGMEFIRDCVESILTRKAAAFAAGVNRDQGKFNAPLNTKDWLETAKPASSGVKALSKKGWTAINGLIVNAINDIYKNAGLKVRISKKELTQCMGSQQFAELTHKSIKNWDGIFTQAEALILEKVANPDTDKEGKPLYKLDAVKDVAILHKWKATREKVEDIPELVIEEISFG